MYALIHVNDVVIVSIVIVLHSYQSSAYSSKGLTSMLLYFYLF